jgi:cytochrome c biogenesis protein CcmG/thiol:disulfide interchange protein DsbE
MMSRVLPLVLFLLLAVLLAVGLKISDKKTEIPSPLIGRPVPAFSLPALFEPEKVFDQDDFLGEPYLINFWASWCVTCRYEHPFLTDLAESGRVRVIGMNFRDASEDAKAWLDRYGDPYDLHITDLDGRISIDFGVYAAPESFLVDASGTIVYKRLGAITPDIIRDEIIPRLDDMKRQNP